MANQVNSKVFKGGLFRLGSQIFKLNAAAMRKWAAAYHNPMTVAHVGTLVYEQRCGEWFCAPIDLRRPIDDDVESDSHQDVHRRAVVITGMNEGQIVALLKARAEFQNDGSHYAALVAASDAIGWPETFKTDLTKHDRIALKYVDHRTPFAWLLQESATRIIVNEAMKVATWESVCTTPARLFIWNGKELSEFHGVTEWVHAFNKLVK